MRKKHAIHIAAIDNSGPNTLVTFLRNAGVGCGEIDVAVAFITAAGLDSLLYLLKRAATRGRVRVLTGLYQWFTEPKALRMLLHVDEQTNGRLSVRLSKDGHFHWKAYMLVKKSTAMAVIGSSNLTDDGLHETGELNVVLSLGAASKEFEVLRQIFERHWESRRVVHSRKRSSPNTRAYENRPARFSSRRRVPIRKILGAMPRKKKAGREEVRYWRTCIDGQLTQETEDLLHRTTNWDKRGYDYFRTWPRTFSIGDRVILFDLNARCVGAIEIVDTEKMPVRTPDGLHFAAYRKVRGFSRRRLVSNRWKAAEGSRAVEAEG